MDQNVEIVLSLKEALLLRIILAGMAMSRMDKSKSENPKEGNESLHEDFMRIDLKVTQGILAAFCNGRTGGAQ